MREPVPPSAGGAGRTAPRWLAAAIVPLAVLVACDSTEPPVPGTVRISGPRFAFDALGQRATYSATVRDQFGEPMPGVAVTWSSGAPSVLEVDPATGAAVARSVGGATLRARADGAVGSRRVTVSQVPRELAKLAGDRQADTVGRRLPDSLVVRAVDANGHPVPGRTVTFVVAGGGGSVEPVEVQTGEDGRAAAAWILGTDAEADQRLRASAGELGAEFTADALPGPPAGIVRTGGGGQTGYGLEPLPEPIGVRVTDEFKNEATAVAVAWSVETGGGDVSPDSTSTDDGGEASATWTLGLQEGEQTAAARVGEGLSVTFTATALPNAIVAGTVSVSDELRAPGRAAPPGAGAPGDRSGISPAAPAPGAAVPDELLVLFRPGALGAPAPGSPRFRAPAVARSVARAMRSALEAHPAADAFRVREVSPAGLAARIRLPDPGRAGEVAAVLGADPRVAAVEPNYRVYGSPPARSPKGVPGAGAGAGAGSRGGERVASTERLYELQAWHYEMIGLPDAWEITTGSRAVTVAVVDDGVRFDHPDLADNLTTDGYDFVHGEELSLCSGGTVSSAGDGDGPDPDPTTPAFYEYDPFVECVTRRPVGGHGTHVAGTIGAVGDNGDATGVNWRVRLRPVRSLGVATRGTTWDAAQGILYAAGLPASTGDTLGPTVQAESGAHVINMSFGSPDDSEVKRVAVEAAADAGSLLVAAVGNASTNAMMYPAAYPEVIAVASLNSSSELSRFSNFGSWIDVAAPGGTSGSYTGDVLSTLWNFDSQSPAWDFFQGTSMASPHVAGVAALLFAANPGATADEVRGLLLDHAIPMGDAFRFGAGRLHALSSLTEGRGFPADLYVRLVDAGTGVPVATTRADPDGAYRFGRLEDGEYLVYAGEDERGDRTLGVPGRRWGAHGGSAAPTPVTVSGSGLHPVSFTIGMPIETEGNDARADADLLVVPGYLNGELESRSDRDWYRLRIPRAGAYELRTVGWQGGCGLAIQANTALELYRSDGSLVAAHDDIDAEGYDFCSRLTPTLEPGTYFLRVTGSTSVELRGFDQASGFYRIRASRG